MKAESIEDLKMQLADEQEAREIQKMDIAELTSQLERSRERTHEVREEWKKEIEARCLHFYTRLAAAVFGGLVIALFYILRQS